MLLVVVLLEESKVFHLWKRCTVIIGLVFITAPELPSLWNSKTSFIQLVHNRIAVDTVKVKKPSIACVLLSARSFTCPPTQHNSFFGN